jgi:ABC-type branched-subunit amino acid transport system substrate-binding protein
MGTPRRSGLSAAAMLAAAVLVAACSTTARSARSSGTGGSGVLSGPGETAGSGGSAGSANGTGSEAVAGAGGAGGASSATGATGGGPGSAAGAVPGGGGVTTGPGLVEAKGGSVAIGIETFAGFQKAGNAFGATGGLATQTAETQANAQFVVDYINSHGGLGGHKLVPVYHDTNIDSSETWDADEQATCAAWTEDNHVFAGLSPEGFDYDTLMSCLAEKHTVLVRTSLNVYDQQYADHYPQLFYAPAALFGNRYAIFVDTLASHAFFPTNSRVGIVRATWPVEARAAQVIRSALAAHGLKVVDEVSVPDETSTTDVANTLSSFSSIVLRFRNEGIDHVLFTQGPVFPLGFMTNAESQGYRPRYALTNQENLTFLQSNAPGAQLQNASGITWQDVPNFPLENAGYRLCQAIHPEAVLNPYCGMLLFIKAAFDRGASPTPASFAAAVQSLGTSFVSPQALVARFTPREYQDGEGAVRPFAWSRSCSCFNYTGGVVAAPSPT